MVDFKKETVLLREAKGYGLKALGEAFIAPTSETSDVSGADTFRLVRDAYRAGHKKGYRVGLVDGQKLTHKEPYRRTSK